MRGVPPGGAPHGTQTTPGWVRGAQPERRNSEWRMCDPPSRFTPRRVIPANPMTGNTSAMRRLRNTWIPPLFLRWVERGFRSGPVSQKWANRAPKKLSESWPVPRTSPNDQGGQQQPRQPWRQASRAAGDGRHRQ